MMKIFTKLSSKDLLTRMNTLPGFQREKTVWMEFGFCNSDRDTPKKINICFPLRADCHQNRSGRVASPVSLLVHFK